MGSDMGKLGVQYYAPALFCRGSAKKYYTGDAIGCQQFLSNIFYIINVIRKVLALMVNYAIGLFHTKCHYFQIFRRHRMSDKKWVYLFDEVDQAEEYVGGSWDKVRALLGGKGANLAEMTRIGVPVPPGFTVTTEACNAYLEFNNQFPPKMWEQELAALKRVEEQTGKKFGDPANPLLVSCRSGAKFSMPGMMDTVLNLGLNDQTADGMVKLTGDERFVYDAYRRLVQMFGSVVLGIPDEPFEDYIEDYKHHKGVKSDTDLNAEDWKKITEKFKSLVKEYQGSDFPQAPLEQLHLATEAVFKSWNGKRAIDYRNAAGI